MPSAPTSPIHRRQPRTASRRVGIVAALFILSTVVGCGSGPTPATDLDATGTVVLPAGSTLELSRLRALGPFGESPLSPGGEFTVPMALAGRGLVAVADAAGDLVLFGFLDTTTDDGEISGASTALALLYLAIGGPFMPGPTSRVLDLVAADPALTALATSVTTILGSDPLALTRGDEELVAAVLAARDAVAARNATVVAGGFTAADFGRSPPTPSQGFLPQDVKGNGNVLITDPGVRGGFDLLVSDDGFGVKVQNNLRRPARLLLYRTGLKSQDGPINQFSTAQPFGEPLVVPPTRSINLFLALEDALGGGAALAPIESDSVVLPLVTSTTRTYYSAVLLAPSLVPGATPPIFTDSRFFPYRSQFDEIIDDLFYETWWTSLLFPLMSSMAFGVTGQVAYASVAAYSPGVKAASAPVLAAAGVANPMTGNRARAMTAAIEQAALGADSGYFYDLVEYTRKSLNIASPPPSSLNGARAFMGTLAKAAGVIAVVDALLSSADIVAMLYDMGNNGPAEAYNPVRLQTRAEIHPRQGQVQRLVAPSQVFNVVIDEPLDGGNYLYRWSTSAEYGLISDYLQDGESFDSESDEVFYLANEPAVITPELFDEISVEVYLDDGSGTIAPGADPVTVASATVVGKERRDLVMGHTVLINDSYPSGETTRFCTAVYVAFERQPDAVSYSVNAFNFYDPYYFFGHFGAVVNERHDFNVYEPPCDGRSPVLVGDEIYLFLSGGHAPQPPDAGWYMGRFEGMLIEVTVTY